ncbi:uncharacterized protein LOC120833384 isoform X2 [Gasterosteus aculeatus]|uniref:uncharacterized protein LOC120833384 isoform X1 n=1 Tax=Gasterosteus aculeatus aculeatus TaxID=481459 RepID=UPI001A98E5A1|nr:uncharacterized protein LOC120833384 isoform X1 [Gasterosteus aculeatus aculeatus]
MGSGTSRGKRVTPACVSEVNVTKTTVGVTPSVQERRSFKPLEVGAILRNARNRAQPDRHSDGHDSDFSGEDDGGMDTFLTDREDRERSAVKTNHAKKTVIRSKTYGLCHRGEEEEEVSSAPRLRTEEASGPNEASRSRDAFTGACPGQRNGFLASGALLEVLPASAKQSTFGSCHSSCLPMPVYDGSEEALMDTIEKEFS